MDNQSSVSSFQESPEVKHTYKWIIILLIIGVFALGIIGWVIFRLTQGKTNPMSLGENEGGGLQTIATPTPLPFQELTVPYLRSRSYSSTLGERVLYANGSNYTSYVTTYTSDGLKINGLLTVPTGDMPKGGWPAVVFVHGYIPPSEYQTTEKYTDYIDYIARNGFVVFKIDLRGHGSSEGEPGGGYYGSDYIVDTLNAREALKSSDFVNGEKIGLWGHSMAGNVTMRSMAVQPDIPATVIWAGAVYTYEDQRKYGIQDSSYSPPANNTQRQSKRRELFDKVGSPSATSEFWSQVAPTNFLDDFKGAVALHHAVDDDVVNIGYSRDLAQLLDKAHVDHEFYEYTSGGHNVNGTSFVLAMQRTVEFYKKHLK